MTFSRNAQHSWSRNEKTGKEGKPKLVIVKEKYQKAKETHYFGVCMSFIEMAHYAVQIGEEIQ